MNTKKKKHLRFLAATLLLATGIMHLLPVFADPGHAMAVPLFLFALMYLIIGGMLVNNARMAPVLGIVIPLLGIVIGFVAIGAHHWDTLMTVMFVINALVVLMCVMLVSGRERMPAVG
ncbi:MAG: hypothetical protein EA363_01790 [Balneolaceae bacterium]|nr:MAG: hypothetical protein EA363_01790 [Balneolaceae bacterium]